MKVSELTPEQLAAEMKKTMKVRALGEPDIFVGYYNHLRRRGGDIFVLRPVVRERAIMVEDPITKRKVNSRKKERILITAEMQFSERWMMKVNTSAQETTPRHFNDIGRGNAANKKKLNIPGMTSKIGGDEQSALDEHNSTGDISDGPDVAGGDIAPGKAGEVNVI